MSQQNDPDKLSMRAALKQIHSLKGRGSLGEMISVLAHYEEIDQEKQDNT